jgi:hypothetical protein
LLLLKLRSLARKWAELLVFTEANEVNEAGVEAADRSSDRFSSIREICEIRGQFLLRAARDSGVTTDGTDGTDVSIKNPWAKAGCLTRRAQSNEGHKE